jgi:serine/threonine protein kinase/roadblock/LC7 domain-containing protein
MSLNPGTRIGPYEVIAPAGAGGMGEVYRVRDTRLNRDVAIKVLPTAFSRDPVRLRRFQQEAQAIAALNHPNILAIHDFGEHEGAPYLVTEFLEGETLRERLLPGAMPVRKSIEAAEQIARGLAAAHDKGIVHRDLKPENIFVTRDGRVKILDFGLAKLTRPEVTSDAATLASQTEPGVVMGTIGYMSPEQVKGQVADHRSDLFSFGAILYEMLSGKHAFQKPTSAETLTAILREDPPVPSSATINVPPPGLQRIVQRCLEKNPEQRFQSASDLAFALGALSDSSSSSTVAIATAGRQAWRPWLRLAAEFLLLGIALIMFFTRNASEAPHSQLQAAILPPLGDGFWANMTQPAAISPDGKYLALIAMRNGQTQLWLRRLDTSEAQPIAGSEDATNPFWSPDSRFIGFFASSKLKKVDIAGGKISDICPSGAFSMGGAWSSQGVIVFTDVADVLKRVPDGGGTPEPISGLTLSSDALGQYWPFFLPDGKHFFYLEWRYATPESHENTVWIASLDGEKPRRIPLTSTNVQYSAGYLLFTRDADLFAQKFDFSRLELSGPALPVVRNIQYDTFFDAASFTVSPNGMLVYGAAGTGVNSELTWMDRNGHALGVLGEPAQFECQAISPDGKRAAVGIKASSAREKIWIYDVDRGTRVPLDPDESGPALYAPRWSPDGKQVAYRSTVGKTSAVYVRASDGSGQERQIGGRSNEVLTVEDWSPDGRYLVVNAVQFLGASNWHDTLQVLPVDGEGKSPLEIDNAPDGEFSPDGHWLAYDDNNSGQLYVTPFPGPGGRIAVSSRGGSSPRWRGDGQELFYVADDLTLISAQVRESPQEFRVLSSQPLFRMPLPGNVGFYDVTRDGKRFLVNTRTFKEQSAPLTVITNWTEQLRNESK